MSKGLLAAAVILWFLAHVPMDPILVAWTFGIVHWCVGLSVICFQIENFHEHDLGELAAAAILAIFGIVFLGNLLPIHSLNIEALSTQMKLFIVLPIPLLATDIVFFGVIKLFRLARSARS